MFEYPENQTHEEYLKSKKILKKDMVFYILELEDEIIRLQNDEKELIKAQQKLQSDLCAEKAGGDAVLKMLKKEQKHSNELTSKLYHQIHSLQNQIEYGSNNKEKCHNERGAGRKRTKLNMSIREINEAVKEKGIDAVAKELNISKRTIYRRLKVFKETE